MRRDGVFRGFEVNTVYIANITLLYIYKSIYYISSHKVLV